MQDIIVPVEEQQGPYEERTAEQLITLARLYQARDQHEEALVQLLRAQHIQRINYGLNAPQQYPAVESAIASRLALHQYQAAAELQQQLVTMYKAHYGADAAEVAPVLEQLGNMYYQAFERGLHDRAADTGLRLKPGQEPGIVDPLSVRPIDLPFIWLRQSHHQYLEAMRILLKRQDHLNPELATLEQDTIRVLFLQAYQRELQEDPDFFLGMKHGLRHRGVSRVEYEAVRMPFYRAGEQGYMRLLAYLMHDPHSQPGQVADMLLQLGDWHVLFGYYSQGNDIYRRARNYLQQSGVDAQAAAAVLAPAVPVQLPTFLAQPYSVNAYSAGGARGDFDGYLDVEFTLDINGDARDIVVSKKSANAGPEVESRLLKVLRNAPFRPRMMQEKDPLRVRYSFAQN